MHLNTLSSNESRRSDHRSACTYRNTLEWSSLIDCDDEARAYHMVDHYGDIAAIADEQLREDRLAEIIHGECSWNDAMLPAYTASRLRGWAIRVRTDPEAIRTVAGTFDSIVAKLPGNLALRREWALQAVFGSDPSPREHELLFDALRSRIRGKGSCVVSRVRDSDATSPVSPVRRDCPRRPASLRMK